MRKTGKVLTEVVEKHFLPADVKILFGDASKDEKDLSESKRKLSKNWMLRLLIMTLKNNEFGGKE